MGLFETARETELVKFARNQTLRTGWCGFAREAQARGISIHVVSLNWSPSWVRLVLREAGCADVAARVRTYAPEILPAGTLPFAAALNHNVSLFSGGDKTVLMERILRDVPAERKGRVVFVSDGDADLRPLWGTPTNVGIVAGFEGSAARTFGEYGVGVWNASEGWKGFTGEKRDAVYGFEDWGDVAELLWS
ncbi:hypothetical protein F5Y01DRAFT_284509 [Xylaria sp. FL0043]|nr:hypothetical protein F5Y01DRAFT_284509 [Xylaria sp. FL0043]